MESSTQVLVQGLRPRHSTTETRLTGDEARRGAGTQDDAIKAVQSLPGFGRGGPGSELIAWGAAPSETRTLIDGVEVPTLYHGSGIRSVVPSELVAGLHATPGAYDARFGRGVGGLVEVETRTPDFFERRLVLSADLLDSSARVSAPLVEGVSAASASGRLGYVDRWLPALIDPKLRGSLYVVPAYWDAEGEVARVFRDGASLRCTLLASADASESSTPSSDPARVRAEQRTLRFGRASANYRGSLVDGAETQLMPFVGWDTTTQRSRAGAALTSIAVSALRYGLRAGVRMPLGQGSTLELGVDGSGISADVSRSGSLAIPRREGDPWPFGSAPAGVLASDTFHANELEMAPYAAAQLEFERLSIVPAVRVDTALMEASRGQPTRAGVPDVGVSTIEALFEPRLSAQFRLSKRASLVSALGRYHQLPNVADLGAVAGNPELGPASAWHFVAGERVDFGRAVRGELRAFYRSVDALTTRNPEPFPSAAQALLAQGRARSFGTELSVRLRTDRRDADALEGFISVSLSRSERLDASAARYRLSDWDSPMALNAALQRGFGAWRISGRARFASGTPRTPIIDVLHDASDGTPVPLFGPVNTRRLPAFFELDLRVDRRFALGAGSAVIAYLDLVNVTLRQNAEEVVYSSDFRSRAFVTGLPPLAILGVRLER